MNPPITIALRNASHTASNYTLNEVRTLAALFLQGNTEQERIEALQAMESDPRKAQQLFGFDLNDPQQQRKATAVIVVRLMNPSIKAQICQSLVSMFPTLPPALVSYRLVRLEDGKQWEDFVYKLEDVEILEIIRGCMEAIAPASAPPPKLGFGGDRPKKKGRRVPSLPTDNETARVAKIDELEQQLAALRSGK